MVDIDIPTILVIAGVFFIFFAIINAIVFPKMGVAPQLGRRNQILLGVVGIIFLISGCYINYIYNPPTTSPYQFHQLRTHHLH